MMGRDKYLQMHPGHSAITKKFVGGYSNPCVDCGMETTPDELKREGDGWVLVMTPGTKEFYLVKDSVWRAAGMPRATRRKHSGGSLCVGCIEKRLGRMLRPDDFQHGTVAEGYNSLEFSTPRLRSRLTGDIGELLSVADEVQGFIDEPPLPVAHR
jgi:hypothetical protein